MGDVGGLADDVTAFLCAAWEGKVTVATVLVLWDWRATLKRFGRLAD